MNFEAPKNIDQEEQPIKSSKKPTTRREFLIGSVASALSLGVMGGNLDKKRLEALEDKTDLKNTDQNIEPEETEDVVIQEEKPIEDLPAQEKPEKKEHDEDRLEISPAEYKKLRPDLTYKEVVTPPVFENLNLIGKETRTGVGNQEGRILRALRFEPIAKAVEDRYNLPPGIILSMVMRESTGIDLLPNGRDDGGFGLSHTQGSVAAEFGLETFDGCNTLRCTKHEGCKDKDGNFKNHGAGLRKFIDENRDDKLKLVEADDRLHWILNLDSIGRMLAAYMGGNLLEHKGERLGPLRTSIMRYSGRPNYEPYWEYVRNSMADLYNSEKRDEVEEQFNALNKNLKINGKPADFAEYMKVCHGQAENYGLSEYKKMPKYRPEKSDAILRSYKQFLPKK